MRTDFFRTAVCLGLAGLVLPTNAAGQGAPVAADTIRHRMVELLDVKWSPPSNGVSTANVFGDPAQPGMPYSMLIRLAHGAWIPPHWHPNDKHVSVLRGTLLMGRGEKFDSTRAQPLSQGGLAMVPAGARHFEGALGETVLLLYGTGPLTTTFIRQVSSANASVAGKWRLIRDASTGVGVPDSLELDVEVRDGAVRVARSGWFAGEPSKSGFLALLNGQSKSEPILHVAGQTPAGTRETTVAMSGGALTFAIRETIDGAVSTQSEKWLVNATGLLTIEGSAQTATGESASVRLQFRRVR